MGIIVHVAGAYNGKAINDATRDLETMRSKAVWAASDIQGKFSIAGQSIASTGKTLSTRLTLPILAGGAAAMKFSADFSRGMGNVATLLPGNAARVDELKQGIMELGPATGKSLEDMSGGLYQTLSAFGDNADTLKILEINAKAATAGVAETTDAINLTSAVTKGYGDTSAKAVQQASDLALLTVRLGQTTFPELAGSIGKVIPVAQNLGVTQEEVFATMATFTGVTGKAADVSTQMRGALQALLAPSAAAAKAIKKAGYESGAALIKEKGMAGAINFLSDAAEKSGKPLQEYIGSVEGQTIALGLAGAQAKDYETKLKSMGDASGTTGAAFGEITDGAGKTAFTFDQMKAKAQVAATQLGDGIAPAMSSAVDAAGPLIDKVMQVADSFSNASPETQQMIIKIGAAVAALGPFLIILGKVVQGASAVIGGIKSTASVIGSIGGGVKSGVQALGRLRDGFKDAGAAQSVFSGKMGTVGGAMRKMADATLSGAKALGTKAIEYGKAGAAALVHGARVVISTAASVAAAAAAKAWAAAQWILNAALNANPISLIVIGIGLLIGAFILAYNKVGWFRDGVNAVFGAIKTVVMTVFGFIKAYFTTMFTIYRTIFTVAWNAIRGVVMGVWNVIKTVVTTYINTVKTIISTVLGTIKTLWTNGWNAVKNFVTTAWSNIKTAVTDGIGGVIGFVKGIPGKIMDALGNLGSTLFNAGKDLIQGLIDGASSLLKNIGKFFLDKLPGWIQTPFKKALGIASPSKVFKGYGKNVIQGFAQGVMGSVGLVDRAMSTMAGKATDVAVNATAGVTFGATASGGLAFAGSAGGAGSRGGTSVTLAAGAVVVQVAPGTTAADRAAITGGVQDGVEGALRRVLMEVRAS